VSKLLHGLSRVVVVNGCGGGASCCSFAFGLLGQHHGQQGPYGDGDVVGTLPAIVPDCTEFHTIGAWESGWIE